MSGCMKCITELINIVFLKILFSEIIVICIINIDNNKVWLGLGAWGKYFNFKCFINPDSKINLISKTKGSP